MGIEMTDYRDSKVRTQIDFKDVFHAVCFAIVFYGFIALACVG
jgi:hypothetical protein